MIYQQQHEAFKRLLIQKGITRIEQLGEALPFGCSAPSYLIRKWLNRMLTLPKDFAPQRRYVNRFKLGADPEFIFSVGGERYDAMNLHLQQGLAFGVDNNGRLVEIRPHPSRSALVVVSSILVTLRWLAALHPEAAKFNWEAGAFLCGDGLGGHVHLGRKRPGRDAEVKALDTIEEELLTVGAYPRAEVIRRRRGDDRHQLYGQLGDIRLQRHGYEYRTFPSWLDSPELAFLTLTLSKLAVQNPGLTQGYAPFESVDGYLHRIHNLLAYYKDVDDDARLALRIIARGFPAHAGGDFKKRWGINPLALIGIPVPKVDFLPASIKPSPEDVDEVFDYFMGKSVLKTCVPKPTWEPLVPPADYVMAITKVKTVGCKGLGELLWDVCQSKNWDYKIDSVKNIGDNACFCIPPSLAKILPAGWRDFCRGQVIVTSDESHYILSNEKMRCPAKIDLSRQILLETVFPFWPISKVKPDSYQQWRTSLRAKPTTKFAGKLIAGEAINLPIKEMRG